MEDFACPRCKTTKYRNPSLKFMVNDCGHALCENCIDLLFVKGSATCPECQVMLRRGNFRIQMFEDPWMEKDLAIRKRVLRDYNKYEEDFTTLREYNDYLEEIEDIIFNLSNDIEVDETRKKMEQYRKDNRDLILRNRNKLSKEQQELEDMAEEEQHLVESQRQLLWQEEVREKRSKTKNKEALIDELMFSDAPASEILATHSALLQQKATADTQTRETTAPMNKLQPTKFSTGIRVWQKSEGFLPVPKMEESAPYIYEPLTRDLWGPPVPGYDQLSAKGYLANTKGTSDQERAGGFVSNIACFRALEEALCGLYHGTAPPLEPGIHHQPMETS